MILPLKKTDSLDCADNRGRTIARPLNAAILVGGKSRRMGKNKVELRINGATLLERTLDVIGGVVAQVALVGSLPEGAGSQPRSLTDCHLLRARAAVPHQAQPRIIEVQDSPLARGPLAGILAVLEWDTTCDWLVLACDMPAITAQAVTWLIREHKPAFPATLALLRGAAMPEPLLAIYTPAALAPLRACAVQGNLSLCRAIQSLGAHVAPVPAELERAWLNVNTPEEWDAYCPANVDSGRISSTLEA